MTKMKAGKDWCSIPPPLTHIRHLHNNNKRLILTSTCIFQYLHFPVPSFSSTCIFQYLHFPVPSFSSTCIFQYLYFPPRRLYWHFPVPAISTQTPVLAFSSTYKFHPDACTVIF